MKFIIFKNVYQLNLCFVTFVVAFFVAGALFAHSQSWVRHRLQIAMPAHWETRLWLNTNERQQFLYSLQTLMKLRNGMVWSQITVSSLSMPSLCIKELTNPYFHTTVGWQVRVDVHEQSDHPARDDVRNVPLLPTAAANCMLEWPVTPQVVCTHTYTYNTSMQTRLSAWEELAQDVN